MTIKVKMIPHPSQCKGKAGGINQVVENYGRHLPQFDVEIVGPKSPRYDLLVGHAGAAPTPDVCHGHGLWWTGDMENVLPNHWKGNVDVISAHRAAKEITVPSNWVAHNIARGMHVRPHVVPHGVNYNEWQGGTSEGYVLWNKGRAKDVCDPKPVGILAAQFKTTPFVTTFCNESLPNIRTTGRLPFDEMKEIIKCAGVYLSTAKETFGIGVLEAMAAGVPVLGFDHGGNSDLVTHKLNGYLVQVDDYEDLARGLDYCISNRDRLSEVARQTARMYTWERACAMVAEVYALALNQPNDAFGVTVVIPSYNYAHKVGRAIESALDQVLLPESVIVVDDGSDDSGATQRVVESFGNPRIKYVRQDNAGVASARNHGVSLSTTRYVCCLDADDAIVPTYLAALVPALEADPLLGVAYTGLMLVSPDGRLGDQSGWPPDCNFDLQLKSRNQIPTCCVFRRKAWKQIGGYRSRYAPQGCGTEDAELWARLGANGWKMQRITNDPLFLYTLGGRTWDKSQYKKTDWLAWHPWSRDHIHPFASIATPVDGRPSHPVHQYDEPIVSVVIPVGPGHTSVVTDALDSLEAQTFRNWEAVVVNDSGESLDLSPWPYVTLVETDGSRGAGYARNRGTEVASANYIVYLDADDFLQSACLERFLAAARYYPNTWIYPDMLVYRANGVLERYECEDFVPGKLWRHGVAPITCLYTKEMWEIAGGFDEQIHREDWDFHLRLAKAGVCGIRLPEPLLTYRHSTGSRRISGSKRKDIRTLHSRYNREEIIKMCRNCGKRTKRLPPNPAPSPPAQWETKEGAGWGELEFVGNNRNDLIFRGGSGRRYIAGNNKHRKVIKVHPDDYNMLLRLRYFKPARKKSPSTMEAQPKPKPPVKAKPSEPELTPAIPPIDDIVKLTVAQVREADLSTSNLGLLLEQESARNPRPRTTVLRMLKVEQRRRK